MVYHWNIVSPGVVYSGIAGILSPKSPRCYRAIVGQTSFGIGSTFEIDEGERFPELPHHLLRYSRPS